MKIGRTAFTARLVLVLVGILLTLGCHTLFGGFEEERASSNSAIGECEPGQFECNEEHLLVCSGDRTKLKEDSCPSEDHCDSANGTCLVCPRADMRRCFGAEIKTCRADRVAWDSKEVCPSAELCSPGGCGECTTFGALQCAVDSETGTVTLRTCEEETRSWVVVSDCPNQTVCDATLELAVNDPEVWDRECEFKCRQGQYYCEGPTLMRCPPEGLNWVPALTCATEAVCQGTLAKISATPDIGATLDRCEDCGTPGAPRCTGGIYLERCSQDQTRWELDRECTDGKKCTTLGNGDCIVCTPGDFHCNGQFLERCGEDRLWTQVQDCRSAALCQVAANSETGMHTGECRPPICLRAGENACGTEAEPTTPGPRRYECSTDLTQWVFQEACESAGLCSKADKKCNKPVCKPGERRCNPQKLLEVQTCKADMTGWQTVTTCKSDQFCDPDDAERPCKPDCPSALRCNDRFLQSCTRGVGFKDLAECQSRELCDCAVRGNCASGTAANGCGKPLCGSDLPRFRCDGEELQRCASGRHAWERARDCGDPVLCFPGEAPSFREGACLACSRAGEERCSGSTKTTCATDRRSFSGEMSCAYGCADQKNCAVCFEDERRCSGTQLLACSADRKTVPVQQNCGYECRDGGRNDYCPLCDRGELRCNGARLETCSSDQQSLGNPKNCEFGCFSVEGPANDRCMACRPGTTRCSGAGVQTCGTDGEWNAVVPCANGSGGCVRQDDVAYCASCSPNERLCAGSRLMQCSADGKRQTEIETCEAGCQEAAGNDFCRQCEGGERRCTSSLDGFTTCPADGSSLGPVTACSGPSCINSGTSDYCPECARGELRCKDQRVLQICTTNQKGLEESQTCAVGCEDNGVADYCWDCRPGQTRCSDDGLQTCNAQGRWGRSEPCVKGCSGTQPAAFCRDCARGESLCDGSALRACNDASGKWSTEARDCPFGCANLGERDACLDCRAGDERCSGPNLQSCVDGFWGTRVTECPLGCGNNRCNICTNGGKRCSSNNTELQVCVNGAWEGGAGGGMSCGNGCSSARLECNACKPPSTECVRESPGQERSCNDDGTWGDPVSCMNGSSCLSGQCTVCRPTATECVGENQFRTCSSSGAWQTAESCPSGRPECVNADCVACRPGTKRCAPGSTDQLQTCSDSGSWGSGADCLGPTPVCLASQNACVPCAPGDKRCDGSDKIATCTAQGTWPNQGVECPSGECAANQCTAPCESGVSQCDGRTLRTCTNGAWTTTNCTIACINSGNADFCADCEGSEPQCSGAEVQTCTNGRLRSSTCSEDTPVCSAGRCVECTTANQCPSGECTNNQCTPPCTSGVRECADRSLRICANGEWTTAPCPNGCINSGDADFCAECDAGEARCASESENGTQTCAGGRWSDTVPCIEGTTCSQGQCVSGSAP